MDPDEELARTLLKAEQDPLDGIGRVPDLPIHFNSNIKYYTKY